MSSYSLFGRSIDSEFELAANPGTGRPDLALRPANPRNVPFEAPAGEVIAESLTGSRGFWVTTGGGLDWRVRMGGTVDATCLDGVARLWRDPSHPEGMEAIGIPNVLSSWLAITGDAVLHASAVEIDGAAVVIAGQPGAGKSSLSHVLSAHGSGSLISEDVVVIRDGQTIPGLGELRLRYEVSDADQSPDGRWLSRPPIASSASTVSTVVIPRIGGSETRAERIEGAAAMKTLLELERVGWWTDPKISETWMTQLAQLLRVAKMWVLDLPAGAHTEQPGMVADAVRRLL